MTQINENNRLIYEEINRIVTRIQSGTFIPKTVIQRTGSHTLINIEHSATTKYPIKNNKPNDT